MPSGIAIAWLPNSLLLAFFLIKDKKEWRYYIPFFIIAEIIADYPTFTIIQSLQFALINICETVISAILIKKLSGNSKLNFNNTKYVILFFLIGLNIIPALSAIFGATVYYTQINTNTTFFEFWRIWFFGDSIGILLLTPLFVIIFENYKSFKNYNFNIQNIVTILLTIYLAIELFSFNQNDFILPTTPLVFILIILWIVYKQNILPALIVSFLIALIAIYYTLQGIGPFSIFDYKNTTIYLQEFIALLLLIPIFFGTLLKDIYDSKEELKELNKSLEKKIEEKTKSLVKVNKELSKLASKDPLTNIYNRRMINEYIEQETTQSIRYKSKLSLIMLDIDYFKKINDNYGHQVGDEIIIEISNIVSKNIRKSDIFGRWGGEEFIILLPQTNIEEAHILAQNIRKKIENHNFEKIGKKTISLGVSEFQKDDNILQFIKRADDAMYKAKTNGRNRVEISYKKD